jgi:cytochrome c oxidase cbb3-type subunit 3
MQGHSYDGIREYDNPMPGWWTWIFVVSVAWAPVYLLGVHVFGFIDTYEENLAEAQAELAAVRETYAATGPAFKTDAGALRAYAADAGMAAAGAAHFAALCAACHGDQGQGAIGPNLTDAYWLHGGAPEDVFRVISEGVVANGMPAWSAQLSDEERAELMAFVFSIQGTNPPGAKAPQGEEVAGF